MDLFFGAFLLDDDLIQNSSDQSGVDATLEAQLRVQLLADRIDVQFLRSSLCLLLVNRCQLGLLFLQQIIQAVIALLELFNGDRTGDVQVKQPILLLFRGCNPAFHLG